MLSLRPAEDERILAALLNRLQLQKRPGGYVLLYEGESPVGAALFALGADDIRILQIKTLAERAEIFDFFARALLYKLSLYERRILIEIPEQAAYFAQFGFTQENNRLQAEGADIVFPSACGHGGPS